MDNPHPGYLLGSGAVAELVADVQASGVGLVIVDRELSPTQERNLERQLGCCVIDRNRLILDIFSQRAHSHEGRLQVEFAQLRYLQTRLIRGWTHLERQRGGIGLRGPGESQLETDRRLILRRIHTIKSRLVRVQRNRSLARRARARSAIPLVALVGRTNAGKSTLFNRLAHTNADVADKLFATLDTTLRRIDLPGGKAILSDTVGFIDNLPDVLVKAFHATLEEIRGADLLLQVIDANDTDWPEQLQATRNILCDIGADKIRTLTVFNKIDLLPGIPVGDGTADVVHISAADNAGIADLRETIAHALFGASSQYRVSLKPEQGKLRAELYKRVEVLTESVGKEGICQLSLRAYDSQRKWLEQIDVSVTKETGFDSRG